jgi:hypothetical protein
MKSNIFIPKKIKVGFQKRTDTYTGSLGYVIYNDGKVWRKEKSWESWRTKYISDIDLEKLKRDSYINSLNHQKNYFNQYVVTNPKSTDYGKTEEEYLKKAVGSYENYRFNNYSLSSDISIKPLDFDNTPLEGFVLNKKVGGGSSGWNHRQTYCRVYDPRGFEFEITIPNLLYILENSNSIKGKGLEGKFIYGWDGTDLILIPENAPEYKEMIEFTKIQDLKVNKKDLVVSKVCITKDNKRVTYLGEFDKYEWNGINSGKHLWFGGDSLYSKINTLNIDNIKVITDEISTDYAKYLESLSTNKYFKPEKIAKEVYVKITKEDLKDLSTYYWRSDTYYLKDKSKYIAVKIRFNNGYNYDLKTYINNYTITQLRGKDKIILTIPNIEELVNKTEVYKKVVEYDNKEETK